MSVNLTHSQGFTHDISSRPTKFATETVKILQVCLMMRETCSSWNLQNEVGMYDRDAHVK